MRPPMTIPSFLKQTKSALEAVLADPKRRVTFVAGNQSADLDSMASSILYSYLSTAPVVDPHADGPIPYIPLLQIPAADLDIRPEFTRLFERLGISASALVTLSDLPDLQHIKEQLSPERTSWVLVDHNALEGDLGKMYSDRVTGVMDHHRDEHAVPSSVKPRRIEVCGSCTSLVIDHFRATWDAASSTLREAASAGLGQLALASILIDTKNMKDESKVRPVDESSEAWCVSLLHGSGKMPDWDRNAFFQGLDEAKKDIDSIPLDGVLRKDYKQWSDADVALGISSVVKPLQFAADRAKHEWNKVAREFIDARQLDIWAIMTNSVDQATGQFQRELYVQWAGDLAAQAVSKFEEQAGNILQLSSKTVNGMEGKDFKIWQQGDVTQTRKQVAPLLREAIKKAARATKESNKDRPATVDSRI